MTLIDMHNTDRDSVTPHLTQPGPYFYFCYRPAVRYIWIFSHILSVLDHTICILYSITNYFLTHFLLPYIVPYANGFRQPQLWDCQNSPLTLLLNLIISQLTDSSNMYIYLMHFVLMLNLVQSFFSSPGRLVISVAW